MTRMEKAMAEAEGVKVSLSGCVTLVWSSSPRTIRQVEELEGRDIKREVEDDGW